jgi:transcriptional regulator with XRE-family HTH domain
MAIDLNTLGSKLAKYRGQLKEPIIELASATGIDAARLTAIEAGRVEPTGDEVLILADHYRCDFKFFISNEQVAPFEQTETLYRAHGSDFTKEDRRAIQDFLYLCETEDFLMRELGHPPKVFSFSPSGDFFKSTARPPPGDCAPLWDMMTAWFHAMSTRNFAASASMSSAASWATRISPAFSSCIRLPESAPWSTTAKTFTASDSALLTKWPTRSSTLRKAPASPSIVPAGRTIWSFAPIASHRVF